MGRYQLKIARQIGMLTFAVVLTYVPFAGYSGEADVEKVDVSRHADGTFTFHVTVKHGDEGWDHYADRWEVADRNGNVIATRTLLHPHVNEQPFTRSLSKIRIDNNITQVLIRAHDNVHGYGGREVVVDLTLYN